MFSVEKNLGFFCLSFDEFWYPLQPTCGGLAISLLLTAGNISSMVWASSNCWTSMMGEKTRASGSETPRHQQSKKYLQALSRTVEIESKKRSVVQFSFFGDRGPQIFEQKGRADERRKITVTGWKIQQQQQKNNRSNNNGHKRLLFFSEFELQARTEPAEIFRTDLEPFLMSKITNIGMKVGLWTFSAIMENRDFKK